MSFTPWNNPPRALKAKDMNVLGDLFALRFVTNDQVELYVEDDGNYFFKMRFNEHWLSDLGRIVSVADAIEESGSASPRNAAIEREFIATEIEATMEESFYKKRPEARVALAIAAGIVRRGRRLSSTEQLANLADAMEEADRENGTNENAKIVDRIRAMTSP